MGNRRIAFVLLGIFVCAVAVSAVSAEREIAYTIVEQDGYRDVMVSTPLGDYVFSEDGGVMKSLFLTFAPYGSTVEELVPGTNTNPETLLRQFVEGAEFPFTLRADGVIEGAYVLQEPTPIESDALEITFIGEFGETTVTKRYTLHEDAIYTVDFQVTVESRAAEPFDLSMVLANQIIKDGNPDLYYLFDGVPGIDRLSPGSYFTFDGLGLMSKSIVFFLSPGEGTKTSPMAEATDSGSRRFGVTMTVPQGTSTFDYSLYGGRRRFLLMEPAGLAALDEPGIGARLMIPVIRFLNILYGATGNYGWAIILFTLLTRVVLFPLMRKQYHSMAKMQKMQPKMKRVQERFKDDKQLQQQKMMELYKKEGVNPMSGCLPLLVQLPILILIWRAILYSAELIHLSPGFLWIPDLSMHDPIFILVIVTTGIMMLQQWLMTPTRAETSGTQKYFGYIFPLFMAVLLWKFPAGLWLYYLLTTGAQVAQQAIVNREMANADARLAPIEVEAEIDDESGDEDAGSGAEAGG
ncbi:MAG: membrane protein insertase YidC [Candidatus Bipolaricaulia bacterium]